MDRTSCKLLHLSLFAKVSSRGIGEGGGLTTTASPTCSFSLERRVRERRGAAGGRRKDLWPHTGINIHKHCVEIYIYM